MTRHSLLASVISIGWAIATVAGMTYGTYYNWPDFVHVNYGFPVSFATHTLNTIAGPVDRWNLSLDSLAVDLGFWSLGMIAIFLIVGYLSSSKRQGSQSKVKSVGLTGLAIK
jgi:hypothetical protein